MRFIRDKGLRNTEPLLLFRIYCLINRHFTTSLYQGKKSENAGHQRTCQNIFRVIFEVRKAFRRTSLLSY